MAPYRQPSTLLTSALKAVSTALDRACARILLESGPYGSFDCTTAIFDLQCALINKLPWSLFEELAKERNSVKISPSTWAWCGDQRVKLSLFMHPSLRSFAVDFKGNELVQPVFPELHGLDEWFWRNHLSQMQSLVELNLNLVATDEILATVGESCPNLKMINVVSRIRQSVVRNIHGSHGHQGVLLRYCVSDTGLTSLLKCQQLCKVVMNKITHLSSTTPSITLDGVRTLLDGLPKLQQMRFGSVGKVLASPQFRADIFRDGSREPLALTHYSETDPLYMDVQQLELACPHIYDISLAVPMCYVTGQGFLGKDVKTSNNVRTTLSLKVSGQFSNITQSRIACATHLRL